MQFAFTRSQPKTRGDADVQLVKVQADHANNDNFCLLQDKTRLLCSTLQIFMYELALIYGMYNVHTTVVLLSNYNAIFSCW